MTDTTITPEERSLLKKVHRQGWDIDEGDMSIYRNICGEITCKLVSDFESPEEIARELAEVWSTAWPIAVRLESAVIKATTRAEKAESENARLRCDYGRWADMISRLPRRIACDACPHRTDRHKMNCLECCPWEAARRAVAGEVRA